MRGATIIPLAALLAGGCTAQAHQERPASNELEAEFMRALEGYVAMSGPVDCVRLRDLVENRGLDERTILFEARGDLVYVNHTRNACPDLRPPRALRFRSTESQLCSGELATVFDPSTGVEYGGCALGDFTPYRREGD